MLVSSAKRMKSKIFETSHKSGKAEDLISSFEGHRI